MKVTKGSLWTIGIVVAIVVLAGTIASIDDSTSQPTPTTRASTTTTTTSVPRTPEAAAEKCFSADGNLDGFERQLREWLNDPGSLEVETHGTYFNPDEDISDGTIGIRLAYSARNQTGETVLTDAYGSMNIHTCAVTVLDYGW